MANLASWQNSVTQDASLWTYSLKTLTNPILTIYFNFQVQLDNYDVKNNRGELFLNCLWPAKAQNSVW